VTGQLEFDLGAPDVAPAPVRVRRGGSVVLCVSPVWSRVKIWRGGRWRKVRTVTLRGAWL
jgi:hypothetical protein